MEEVKEVFSNKSTKIARIRNIFILTMLNGENKFNPSFMTDLNSALDYVEKCPDGVALVTTGGQEKFYSTGLDIPYLMSVGQDAKALSDFMVQFQSLIARILVFPVPTVAAINGHCYAGAAFFALAHDYRVMRKDRGFFCLPEIDLKLAVPPGLMDLLKAKVSDPAYLRELIIYGNKVGGVEAHKMGVIDGAASSSQVLVESIAMVQGLASKDKATLKALKIELYSPAYKKLLAAELGQAEKNFSVFSKL
jgi:enoyl-CoA hydratase/carnithine racemase